MTPESNSTDWDRGLPVFNEARCVHDHVAGASCRACADACPNGALALAEEALELDVDACDGCALCVAACPQQAIESRFGQISAMPPRKNERAYLACAKSAVTDSRQTIPCAHALSWRDALRLHRSGVREIAVAVGNCNECQPRITQLDQTLLHVNEVLSSRHLPELMIRYLTDEQWGSEVRNASKASGTLPSRRAFLRRIVDPGHVTAESELPATVASLLGESDAQGSVFPAVPVIEPERCDGCDACVRVCLTGAITLVDNEAGLRYRVDASHCTGCDLCSDVCQPDAISVQRWAKSPQQAIELKSQQCPACGIVYHTPNSRADDLCTICAKTHRHRNLFQVDPA